VKLTLPLVAVTAVTLMLGCGVGATSARSTPGADGAPMGPVVLRVSPHGETKPVEVGGIAPNDTILLVRRGAPRVVILRHGPPDRAEFLELELPVSVFAQAARDTIHVTIKAAPGIYGAELSADADWGPGAALSFKYAIHFYPPADAMARYHNLAEVERRLTVARREHNGDLTLYLSTRPAPDVVRALIPGAGAYVMTVTN
jgi:hypothetical protein